MAKPRIFISSTFYDLKHIRSSLEAFIQSLGYEPVLSEKGRIAYDPEMPLDESCYRDAASSDILVLIVGGRYGAAASTEDVSSIPEFYDRYESITKKEFEAAFNADKPVYILIERQVFSEFETYKKNPDNKTINYAHADSINVFKLIDSLLSRSRNNPIQQFENPADIEEWLREQWAGFFRELINRRSEQKQIAGLSDQVADLASINASLQRYLEAVVSRVSEDKQEASELIQSEQQRLITDKMFREFEKTGLVAECIDEGVSREELADLFRRVRSIDEFAAELPKIAEALPTSDLIKFWRKNLEIVEDINDGRAALGLDPLKFELNESA